MFGLGYLELLLLLAGLLVAVALPVAIVLIIMFAVRRKDQPRND